MLIGLADISDTAWRKRMRRANPFLAWLLSELLAAAVASAPELRARQRRVLLVDATRLRQIGGTGDDWRVHLSYDLLAGRIAQVLVTDQKGAEQLGHFELQADDIFVGVCGYGYRKNLAAARERKADVVLRVWIPNVPLEHHDGSAFDALAWLEAQHASVAEWHGICRFNRRRYEVHLIASKLPADKVAAARKRKARKAQKNGRVLSVRVVYLASWLVVLTTLDEVGTVHGAGGVAAVVPMVGARRAADVLHPSVMISSVMVVAPLYVYQSVRVVSVRLVYNRAGMHTSYEVRLFVRILRLRTLT